MIRKFIVKYFALSYRVNLLGIVAFFPRASAVIVPLILTLMLGMVVDSFILRALAIVLLVPSVWISFDWFGIGYFAVWPVKWGELDTIQKYIYGGLPNAESYMSMDEIYEYRKIVKEFDK